MGLITEHTSLETRIAYLRNQLAQNKHRRKTDRPTPPSATELKIIELEKQIGRRSTDQDMMDDISVLCRPFFDEMAEMKLHGPVRRYTPKEIQEYSAQYA